MTAGLLFDATRCIGCEACSAACKEQNVLPLPIEARTTAYTWTTVLRREGVNLRILCMHCLDPTCVSVCPVGALQKTAEGPVVYDAGRCIGCRYCILACPFGVPKYQWDRPLPVVGKCVMCFDRVKAGQATACAAVCPTGATAFGEREELIREARGRIREAPERYVDHVYGEEEAGGTSVLMLSPVPFATLGLRTNLPKQPLPLLTWQVLSKVPDFVALAGVFLYGLFWITKRRDEVQAVERSRAAAEADPPETGWLASLRRRLRGKGRPS